MGDSITALWDLGAYDSSPTLNFGKSGDNTTQMLARFHNQVIDSDPAVVVILGGVNDFQEGGQAGTNTDSIRAMALEAQNGGIKVILCSVLPTDYPNPNLNGTTDDSLFIDHIHPNAAGYARMWAVQSPLLKEDLQ